jgi:hypothetical protein
MNLTIRRFIRLAGIDWKSDRLLILLIVVSLRGVVAILRGCIRRLRVPLRGRMVSLIPVRVCHVRVSMLIVQVCCTKESSQLTVCSATRRKSSHDFLGFRRVGVSTCYNALSYTGYRDASDGSCKRVPVWSAKKSDDTICQTYPLVPMYWTNPATVLASEPWACSTSPLICSSAEIRLRDKIDPPLPVSLSTWY